MNCTWIDRDDVFEGYVREALDAGTRDAFEEHVIGCDACAERLETYRLVRLELADATRAGAPAAVVSSSRPWWEVSIAAAAGLVIIASIAFWLRGGSTPVAETTIATSPPAEAPAVAVAPPVATTAAAPTAPTPAPAPTTSAAPPVPIAVLARVEAPIYLPPSLRGPRDEAEERFDAGMQRYVAKDYAGAIPDLRAAASLNPKAPFAAFFLAMCQLLTGDVESAAAGLEHTVALGESPYLEEAHFYLAKARLRQGDLAAARAELTLVVERRGRLEQEARGLLEQLKQRN